MRLLLTGTRAPVALDLARAFRACGHEVHGVDSLKTALPGKALNSFTLCTSPRCQPEVFPRDAGALVNRLRPHLVIPLCEDIFYWAQLSERYGWPIFAPDLATLMRLHSKLSFIGMARSLALAVPETQIYQKDNCNTDRSVLKPEFSRFGARIVVRPKALPNLPDDPANPWLRQDYVAGEDISFHAVARGGRLRAFSAYRSAWRTVGGASYFFEPLPGDICQQLIEVAGHITEALQLTGQFACDVRRDTEGKLWLIECNPRATSGLHLLAADPQALAAAFLNDDGDLLTASAQPACVGAAMWLDGLPKAILSGRLGEWRRDTSRARDVFAGVRWPAMAGAISLVARAALKRQSLASFLTTDIECNRDLTCS